MFYSNPGLFLVVIFEDTLIGYIVGNIETQKRNLKTKKVGHIMNIAVIPRFRKLGVGSLLIKELEKRLYKKGVHIAYLEVRESNNIAQKFYLNRGYVRSNIIHRYYGDENAILMVKNLRSHD
jgi:ribosomal-protein-alanine N-acetyltransferase